MANTIKEFLMKIVEKIDRYLLKEESAKRGGLSNSEIWKFGSRISNEFGFWGSHNLLDSSNPKEYVAAFIEVLRGKGYDDAEIILLGDFKAGRIIGDVINSSIKINEFKKYVNKYSPSVQSLRTNPDYEEGMGKIVDALDSAYGSGFYKREIE